MKEIPIEEVKKLQLDILKYINEICKNNNIDYFLISGSLLGAIRHNGFIPWDDDIDIALTSENYIKLKDLLLRDNNEKYMVFDNSIQNDYYYPFMKLVDKRTILIENNYIDINNFGINIDIFEYTATSNDEDERRKQFKKLKRYKKDIYYYTIKKCSKLHILIYIYSKFIKKRGIKNILKKYEHEYHKFSNIQGTQYLISNWPSYDLEHEIQKKENLENFIYHKFENIEVKISKDYDLILRKQFGDYMKLPPEEKRISNHDVKIFWK